MRHTTRFALAVGGALVLATPALAQTKWNLPGAYPQDNPHTENLSLFAKDVAEATGGKLQITVHAGASLFKAPDIKRAVQTGQAQMGEVLISNHENEDPIFGLDVVPFLATSYDQAKKLWDAQRPAIEKKLESQNLKLLFAVPWAPQGLYAKKDINTLDDMKGPQVAGVERRHGAHRRARRGVFGDRAGGGARPGARDRRRQRLHDLGGDRLRLEGLGVA